MYYTLLMLMDTFGPDIGSMDRRMGSKIRLTSLNKVNGDTVPANFMIKPKDKIIDKFHRQHVKEIKEGGE